jgi:hypothetical protein
MKFGSRCQGRMCEVANGQCLIEGDLGGTRGFPAWADMFTEALTAGKWGAQSKACSYCRLASLWFPLEIITTTKDTKSTKMDGLNYRFLRALCCFEAKPAKPQVDSSMEKKPVGVVPSHWRSLDSLPGAHPCATSAVATTHAPTHSGTGNGQPGLLFGC